MDNKENEVQEDEVKAEGEVLQKEYEFISQGCQFKQRGIYLVCVSCEIQHAIHIGIDKIMVGEDEKGMPIIISKKEYYEEKKA